MNKNALKGKARQGRVTKTGKAPDNVGFPGGNVTGGGVVRKLTPQELDGHEMHKACARNPSRRVVKNYFN